MTEAQIRLGVVIDGEASLAGRKADPVDFVIVRSTFLNPPRAAAAKRVAERIHANHPSAEVVPYAWHYLTHEAGDGIEPGNNRSLAAEAGTFGHLRGKGSEQAWTITELCAEAFGAKHVVLRTPPSFSPGALSRRRLDAFLESRAGGGLTMVWEPTGLWSLAEAAAVAGPRGAQIMGPALAMTGHVLDFSGAQWLRVSGGKQGLMRASHAEMLALELVESDITRVQVAFEGPRAYANLRQFSRALQLI